MKLWQSLLCSFITWPLLIVLSLVIYISGLFLIPLALIFKAYEDKFTIFGYFRTCFSWPIMVPYQNFEDGIAGPTYYEMEKAYWKRVVMWSIFRNPVNGMRWLPYLSCKIRQDKIRYVGTLGLDAANKGSSYELKQPSFVYVWCGPYSGFWWHFMVPFLGRLVRLQLGHKLYANDAYTSTYGYRQHGTAFAAAAKLVQLGDNRN